jgi:hypothetical protein
MLAHILSHGITRANINTILGKNATVTPWLSGHYLPSQEVMEKFATACNIPVKAWREIVEPGDTMAVIAERARIAKRNRERAQRSRGPTRQTPDPAAKLNTATQAAPANCEIRLRLRCTTQERIALEQAAASVDKSVSAWLKELGLRETSLRR